jgi:FAD/FMN-containing dehydrogenase
LRTVRSVDPANHTLTVDAGVTVAGAAEAAERAGRLFPLRFGAEGTAQIGGALSTNAGGTAVLRYGSARDLTLGVEVVLADGRIYSDLAGLRKDNTGYALSDLFVGAEGTLGIITGATLKLFPRPIQRVTALVAPTSVPSAVELLGRARSATDDRLVAFEWIGRGSLELLDSKRPLAEWTDQLVLLEATSGTHADELAAAVGTLLSQAIADGVAHDAAVAGSAADREAFWSIRDGIPEAEKQTGGSLKHDVAVAIDDVAEMLDLATDAVGRIAPTAQVSAFGHLGDGNIHFNLLGHDRDQEVAITQCVFDVVAELGGSFSAEHGVGRLRREELVRRANPVALELMRSIKDALDPDGLMNPGAVL